MTRNDLNATRPTDPRSAGVRTVLVWSALLLVALYVWCAITIATMPASAGLGAIAPYGIAVAGTVVVGLCLAMAIGVVALALRPPARRRSVIGLATGAFFGAYVFIACLIGIAWSVGGLLTDTGVTDATWLVYLAGSLAGLAVTVALTVRAARRRPVT